MLLKSFERERHLRRFPECEWGMKLPLAWGLEGLRWRRDCPYWNLLSFGRMQRARRQLPNNLEYARRYLRYASRPRL